MTEYIDAAFGGLSDGGPTKTRLVAFPEFSFGAVYNTRTTTEEVKKYQCITIPGPETDALAAKARQYNTYIVACNNENDPAVPDYFFNTASPIQPEDGRRNTLLVHIDPPGSGTVSVLPNKSSYNCGEQVTLTAHGTYGANFDEWSGGLTGGANPVQIQMFGPRQITANFTPLDLIFVPQVLNMP